MTSWKAISSRIKRNKIAFAVLLLFGVLGVLDVIFPFSVERSYAHMVYARDGKTLLHATLSKDDKWRLYTELSEISPLLKKTIIHKEDRFFYYHFGVNPVSVVRAFFQNLTQRRRISGASTITMQVVRLLEPRARTYTSKAIETFRALQLEWHYSKDEILQLYLNLIPYGGNVEGVKAAARLYFQCAPEQLSLAQVVALAIVPNRPSSWALGKNNAALLKARNRWLRRLAEEGVFSAAQVADALAEPLQAEYRPMPRQAPHLSRRLIQQNADTWAIVSTLDARLQAQTERLTKDFSARLHRLGIYNAAVLVVENKTGQVRAYVGSPNFSDSLHGGQVDGIQANRSPGSTLKPLLYGLAFDAGLLTPRMPLLDVPIDIDGYQPQNFDGQFHGKVSAETALAYSLNVPAVRLLQTLGVQTLVGALQKARFAQIDRDSEKLGLSLALGGCGVTLEELVALYLALARGGRWSSLLDASQDSARLLSEGATYMIHQVLLQVQRPDLPSDYKKSRNVPKIAWKTGTSYGRHDAWSIGFSENYTIGVWLGNFSGKSSPFLTGSQVATPLLFKLFLSLDYDAASSEDQLPKSISFRKVCVETGLPPSAHCAQTIRDTFLPGLSPHQTCDHLQAHWVARPEATHTYCITCLPSDTTRYQRQLYPNIAPELLTYYTRQGITYARLPPHYPQCPHVQTNTDVAPRIQSPVDGRSYLVSYEDAVELELLAQVAHDVQFIYWYVDGKFIKKVSPHEKVFFQPALGRRRISCTDDRGRNTDIEITVE